METVISRIAAFLGILATLATLVMMIGIVVDVFFRALYDGPSPASWSSASRPSSPPSSWGWRKPGRPTRTSPSTC
jgi:hypothetical protein